MPTQATPSFGDLNTAVANPLTYPRRIVIDVLRSAFAQDSMLCVNTEIPNQYKLVLAENGDVDPSSSIMIQDSFAQDLSVVDKRPLIVVSRGEFSFSDTTLEAARGFGGAQPSISVTDADNNTATVHGNTARTKVGFQDYTSMGISVSVYSRHHLVTDDLSNHVMQLLRIFRQPIRDGARLHKLGSPVVSPIQQLRGDSEGALYVCQITLLVYQTVAWENSTSATYNAILAGIQNLSNSPWPVAIGSTPCVGVEPEGLTEEQSDEWNGNND